MKMMLKSLMLLSNVLLWIFCSRLSARRLFFLTEGLQQEWPLPSSWA